jgi:hypothetical protein
MRHLTFWRIQRTDGLFFTRYKMNMVTKAIKPSTIGQKAALAMKLSRYWTKFRQERFPWEKA